MLKVALILFVHLAIIVYGENIRKPYTCTFPFIYKGQEYNECIKLDASSYWCSVYKVYNGTFSYCKVDDKITEDHFLEIIERAEQYASKLSTLQDETIDTQNQCMNCMGKLVDVTNSVEQLGLIYMDENKRIQGLKKQHRELNEVVEQIKQFYQRRRCRQTERGADYMGQLARTVSGQTCQAWSSQSPHSHGNTEGDAYSDGSVSLAKNHCRNPSVKNQPWCYTTDRKNEWEYCHVPRCGLDCRIDSNQVSDLPMCDSFQSSSCPPGSTFYSNYCYVKFNTRVDYATAESNCEKINASLVSIHSVAENEFVAKQLAPQDGNSFYIGLNDRVKEGRYEYTDGTQYNYHRFYSGEPNNYDNEDCIEVGRYRAVPESWNDISCDSERGFVCKFKL